MLKAFANLSCYFMWRYKITVVTNKHKHSEEEFRSYKEFRLSTLQDGILEFFYHKNQINAIFLGSVSSVSLYVNMFIV